MVVRYLLFSVLIGMLALLCYLTGPSSPARAREVKSTQRNRLEKLAHTPTEENGYTVLAFIPRPGNPPEREAVYNLNLHHASQEIPLTTGLPQALAAFRRFRPLFDQALSRSAFLYPTRQGDAVEGLALAGWLARAYLVDALNQEQPEAQMRVARQAWRLGYLSIRNENLPTLRAGTEMVQLAADGLRPLVSNGKLSPDELLDLSEFLEQNRLQPVMLVQAADAEALHFEEQAGTMRLAGAGEVLPQFLSLPYRGREVRAYDVCYFELRPCLLEMVPCASRHLDLQRTLEIMRRNGDRMAVDAFPELDKILLDYRFVLDRQDQLLAGIALQRAWTPERGYPELSDLPLELSPRLRWERNRLVLAGEDYPERGPEELEMPLKPPGGN